MQWLAKWMAAWFIRKFWGPRCKEISLGCGGCDAWLMYDYLFGDKWFDGDVKMVKIHIYVPETTVINEEE